MVADELSYMAETSSGGLGSLLYRLAQQLDTERIAQANADAAYMSWSLGGGMAGAVLTGMALQADADGAVSWPQDG